jgi:hypothetical protein
MPIFDITFHPSHRLLLSLPIAVPTKTGSQALPWFDGSFLALRISANDIRDISN